MQKLFPAVITAILLLSACNTQPTNTYRPAPPIGEQQQTESDAQMILPEQPSTPATQSGNSSALNPEHGQPGHRCDIAVGAPLNGTPNTNQEITSQLNTGENQLPATLQTETAPVSPAPAAQSKSGNKKLNPEHGQPGHDCAVPVGSPLP